MGAAACYHLARRGARVLGLDQYAIPHQLGAHHGFSRMIRLAYYEHPDYVPLLKRAYQLWEELEKDFGQRLLYLTGGLYMGAPRREFLDGALKSAQAHELPHRYLKHETLAQRYPCFRVPADYEGIYEEKAGFLVPELVMAAHVQGALSRGAVLRGHVRVESWQSDDSGIEVVTSQGMFRGKRLLITAGAWSQEAIRDEAIRLTVTRQTWGWFWPEEPDRYRLGEFPGWFYECEDGGGFYGFPMMPDNPGLKLAWHHPAESVTPDTVCREPQAGDERPLRTFLENHLPGAAGPLLAIRTCLYTNSSDGHFIIDRHPEKEGVFFACGFSGHGFKFASVMGEVLADLAESGKTAHPIDFLGLARFH